MRKDEPTDIRSLMNNRIYGLNFAIDAARQALKYIEEAIQINRPEKVGAVRYYGILKRLERELEAAIKELKKELREEYGTEYHPSIRW